ncbi:MAG: hypothetical protein [Circoviridae sp.]|nr:MAG: hypothetical protein [Circoviridae sp.]
MDTAHTTVVAAAIVSVLAAVRLSRCTRIKCCGCECERRLVDDAGQAQPYGRGAGLSPQPYRRPKASADARTQERNGQGSSEPSGLPSKHEDEASL